MQPPLGEPELPKLTEPGAASSSARSSGNPLVLLSLSLALALALLLIVGLAARLKGFDPAWVFRDLIPAGRLPTYAGFIASLGNMLWVITAGICLFGSLLILRVGNLTEEARFLLASGLLTALLGLDDTYLFHERIAPKLLRVPEQLVLAGYGALAAGIFLRFRRLLLGWGDVLLAGALVALSGSVAVDVLAPNRGWYHLVEDGSKFIGIWLWATFYVRLAFRLVLLAFSAQKGSVSSAGML